MITSAHNSKIQLARALIGRPRERRDEKAFVAEGVRLVEEAVNAKWPVRFGLYTQELNERGQKVVEALQARNIPCEEVSSELFNTVSDTHTSQGLLAVLEHAPLTLPQELSFALILDSVRDPGNLGTLLRTADAAGVEAVFLPPETTDAFAPKVVRAGWAPISTSPSRRSPGRKSANGRKGWQFTWLKWRRGFPAGRLILRRRWQ